ncbi:hypothetical protein [Streptomyces lydicus]|uniref:hypothetical protein n=1 Tax=Streptomyces lydicus TaxID=47763 RepID=UPI0010125D1C|nr:hypothetical protein [Streptomyces lydicus]MCZ1005477.1 hypothetical protein [Streptomyces lydicus]
MAGLLVDLAADPRELHADPTVVFPLHPAARALGVPSVIVRTALCRLAEAGLLNFRAEDHQDGPQMTVTLLPPDSGDISEQESHAQTPTTLHGTEDAL